MPSALEARVVEISTQISKCEQTLKSLYADLRNLMAHAANGNGAVPDVVYNDSLSDRILKVLRQAGKGVRNPEIFKKTGGQEKSVRSTLSSLKKRGMIRQVRRGVWGLPMPREIVVEEEKEGGLLTGQS